MSDNRPGEIRRATSPERKDHEAPYAIAVDGWRYHHIGIPTQTPRPGELYLASLKMHVSGFESSPYGIQWMRFDADSTFPAIIRTVPHVAFEVDNLAAALEGKEILVPPNCPSDGITVAMIVDDGAPVELLEFRADLKPAAKSGCQDDGLEPGALAMESRPAMGGKTPVASKRKPPAMADCLESGLD